MKLHVIVNPITGENLQVAKFDSENQLDWYQAKKKCEEFGEGWRLPTISELKLIYKELHQKENFQPAVYWSRTESSSMRAWTFDFGYGTDDHGYYKENKAYTIAVNTNTIKKTNTQFSLFDGFSASDLISPFDFWKNFIDDEFADFKINQNSENLHFHCCIIPENEDLSENDFLYNFFQKLPFILFDNETNTTHFWFQTPELKILLQEETTNFNADKIGISLLDSISQLFSKMQKMSVLVFNINDFETIINKAKNKILETGMLKIIETFIIKHQIEFKNKFWI